MEKQEKTGKTLKILALVLCSLLWAVEPLTAGNDLFEVTVKARGANEEEALASAIDDAIRRSLGALFAERSQLEGEMLEEKLIQFSRGTATHYTILESSSDDSGVTLTVSVTVDSVKLKENARTIEEGTGSASVQRRQTPHLEAGQKALSAFFKNLRYESFLGVALEEKKLDPRKGFLTVTVALSFDRASYASNFAEPLMKTLDKIFAPLALQGEIQEEFAEPMDRFASTFHVLGENFSSREWMLPRNFYDVLKREARFWDATRGKIQTHKRIWLHFYLLDAKGKEIGRLPVHLKVSNVLLFSEERKDSPNPWFFMKLEETGIKVHSTLVAAPRFGAIAGGEYVFFERFTQPFEFHLPEDLLTRIGDVKVALELER
jgi:hypothetical protein